MNIGKVEETEHTEFLSLVNAEIRPDRAKTTAWDDFPLILGLENRHNQLVCRSADGRLAGGIACLIRDFKTSCGTIPVAGIGSVVTHPDFRGKGLSSVLQNEMLALVRRKNVPLAVLWSDKPEIYSGRGFAPAGWELHAYLDDLTAPDPPAAPEFAVREFRPADTQAVEELYLGHPLGTVRRPGDSLALYTMPGTSGLVAVDPADRVLAAVFCGKGADFPDYIAEWSGPEDLAVQLMAEARQRGLASKVLIPPGVENMVNVLVDLGCGWSCQPAGLWKILDEDFLRRTVGEQGLTDPVDGQDAAQWLGYLAEDGQPLVGPVTVAVWGFDSV